MLVLIFIIIVLNSLSSMGNTGPEFMDSHLHVPYAQQKQPNYPNYGDNTPRNQSPHHPHIYNPYGSLQNPNTKLRQDYSNHKLNRTNPNNYSPAHYIQQSPRNHQNITMPNIPQMHMPPKNRGVMPPTAPINYRNPQPFYNNPSDKPIQRPQSAQKSKPNLDPI